MTLGANERRGRTSDATVGTSPADLEALLPAALAWAEAVSRRGLSTGVPLSPEFLRTARRVGVRSPGRIRLTVSRELPEPEDSALRDAALRFGLSGRGMIGLTLGYAIFILDGHLDPLTLSHECRHVQQYEVHGGVRAFLPIYLADVIAVGYFESRFEKDARGRETDES